MYNGLWNFKDPNQSHIQINQLLLKVSLITLVNNLKRQIKI